MSEEEIKDKVLNLAAEATDALRAKLENADLKSTVIVPVIVPIVIVMNGCSFARPSQVVANS